MSLFSYCMNLPFYCLAKICSSQTLRVDWSTVSSLSGFSIFVVPKTVYQYYCQIWQKLIPHL